MQLQPIASVEFTQDFYDTPAGRGPDEALAPGSRNLLCLALGWKKAFLGLTFSGQGSRVQSQVKATYGGLSDRVSGSSRSIGSITAGANTLTDTGAPFVIGDDGKAIQLIATSWFVIDRIDAHIFAGLKRDRIEISEGCCVMILFSNIAA